MIKKREGAKSCDADLLSSLKKEGRSAPFRVPAATDLPWLVLTWLSRCQRVFGLKVCVAASKRDAGIVYENIEYALQLIAAHDSRVFGQIQRDLRCILVSEASGAHFFAGIGTCRIGIGYVKQSQTIELAMVLVHEAAHARFAREGVRYQDCPGLVERACVEAEIAFAEKVPGSENAIRKTRELLSSEWWDIDRHGESIINDLVQRGVPHWLARWIVARNLKR